MRAHQVSLREPSSVSLRKKSTLGGTFRCIRRDFTPDSIFPLVSEPLGRAVERVQRDIGLGAVTDPVSYEGFKAMPADNGDGVYFILRSGDREVKVRVSPGATGCLHAYCGGRRLADVVIPATMMGTGQPYRRRILTA